MRPDVWRVAAMVAAVGLLPLCPIKAADPEIDSLLQSPIGKDWVANGGNLTNQRYSTLKQIDTTKRQAAQGRLDHPSQRLRARRQILV